MKKILIILFIAASFVYAQSKESYSPTFYGYVRAWHQTDLSTNQGKFLVKMARLGVKGNINEYSGYKIFVDFTRLGKLQTTSTTIENTKVLTGASSNFSDVLLDAEAIIKPVKNLTFSLGQFKVPFSTDNLRSGATIDFVNRPLLTKVAPGLRDIGFMCSYSVKDILPIELNAGLFNGAGQNSTENDQTINYSFRTAIELPEGFGISANYYGGKVSGSDVGVYDLGLEYKYDQFYVTGEYGNRVTTKAGQDYNSNAYFVYALYNISIDSPVINMITPAVRYENYDPNDAVSNNGVSRITTGLAFQFAKIKSAQFRVNYELFDNMDGSINPNQIIFEIQTKF